MRFKSFLRKAYKWLKREPYKKYKQIRYRVWLSLKQISFKDRDEKIKRVEKILSENLNIFFTADLVKTGFTDQLIGFNFLYKMGRGLGLKYYHKPLSAHRSSDPFLFDPITQNEKAQSTESSQEKVKDIFDFLGINEYLESQTETITNPGEEIAFNLNIMLYGREGIQDYESLIEEMKVILYPFLRKGKKLILCFKAEPRTYFHFYRYVADQKEHEIDYYNCFKQFKRGDTWGSEFEPGSTNMLVHIRQGDTGTIETPWNTFIPVWHEIEGKFTQFENERDIPGHKRIHPNEFYQFIRDLQAALAIKDLSTVVFSDGYKKAFRWIYLYHKEKDISAEEIKKLNEMEPNYDKLQFGAFRELEKTQTVIGEDVEKLYRLVYSFFDTDILVAGTQALMMPKLMATYGNSDKMPFLIVLYHTQKPFLDYIGFKDSSPFLMFVDIKNYNISDISKRVSTYLESKQKV